MCVVAKIKKHVFKKKSQGQPQNPNLGSERPDPALEEITHESGTWSRQLGSGHGAENLGRGAEILGRGAEIPIAALVDPSPSSVV